MPVKERAVVTLRATLSHRRVSLAMHACAYQRGLGCAGVEAQQPRLSIEKASRMSARVGHPSQAD